MSARDDAERFGELFAALFHRFHRHDPVADWQPSPEALALLEHLTRSGPLTVHEAQRHFGRSQAATSELLQRLERRGLLERRPDERDRRRTLVWLSDAGLAAWRSSRRVLDHERLAGVLGGFEPAQRAALLEGLRALVEREDPRGDEE